MWVLTNYGKYLVRLLSYEEGYIDWSKDNYSPLIRAVELSGGNITIYKEGYMEDVHKVIALWKEV